jgi:serine/threonine protein kinase/uncharacterized protein YecT (DUF1311 family)
MSSEPDFPSDLQALESDYELIRELGQGGMAAVYLARRRDSGRLVAIKAIRARYLDDPDALQRFAREARTVADLDHPNIVRTEAIEQIGDRAVAIIMEYIASGTLRDRLREYGAFSAEQTEGVLRDVASALAYAHRRGIVHRDVKPENVFLDSTRSRAVLSDFGIARRIEGEVPITILGAALGTPQYMSPEQIDGRAVDGRTDIYSLGVLGWELLTGRRPWAGENLYGVIYKQKHDELPRITSLRPRVPANLLFAIEGALVKDRERRWQTVDEFLEHLTYDPPPVLAQAFPAGAMRADNAPTVEIRREAPPATDGPETMSEHSAHEPAHHPPTALTPPAVAAHTSRRADEAHPVADTVADADRATPRREGVRHAPSRSSRNEGRRRPFLLALALLVPLAIAATSWYVLLGDRIPSASESDASDVLTSSSGGVALDTTEVDSANVGSPSRGPGDRSAPRDTARVVAATPPRSDSAPAVLGRDTAAPRSAAARREAPPAGPAARPPSNPPRASSPPGAPTGPVPSERCRLATVADQRACLLAYIALNDAALQRVYDSLIVELRRIAGTPRGAPDPPNVTRLRVEQRAWIGIRDRECTRRPAPGSVPYWAQPLSECFAEMSAARADELGAALRRMRDTR